MLQVLQERGFDHCDIIAAASPKSVGKTIPFAGRNLTVISVPDAINSRPDYAVFSAGASASRQYAPLFAQNGCTVIDNSSCWRMDDNVPLVVPEINMHSVSPQHRIIANLVVSTYQSITGTGIKAVRQLESEEDYYFRHHTPSATLRHDIEQDLGDNYQPAYPHQIFRNLFPHGGDFLPDGYTTEEQKLVNESRKILSTPELLVSATVARVPVVGGHSESVNVEFLDEFTLDEARDIIASTPGVVLCDDPSQNLYPTPVMAQNKDQVFVGRLRRDPSQPRSLNLWVVSDNLRKGAATNAIQILQQHIKLFQNK